MYWACKDMFLDVNDENVRLILVWIIWWVYNKRGNGDKKCDTNWCIFDLFYRWYKQSKFYGFTC